MVISNNLEHGVSNECRDRSRNFCRSNKGHDDDDGNHGQTLVVKFSTPLDFHLLELTGGKVDWRENNGVKKSALSIVCCFHWEKGAKLTEVRSKVTSDESTPGKCTPAA